MAQQRLMQWKPLPLLRRLVLLLSLVLSQISCIDTLNTLNEELQERRRTTVYIGTELGRELPVAGRSCANRRDGSYHYSIHLYSHSIDSDTV